MPGLEQPCQKHFDTLIWDGLRRMDPAKPVFIESESKKVGDLSVPAALVEAMRTSACLKLALPDDERVALLLEDYDYLVRDVDYFCDRLGVLTALKGRAIVQRWQELARAGQFAPVVQDLLVNHYDPAYFESMQRNFVQFENAKSIAPTDHSIKAMAELAQQLLNG